MAKVVWGEVVERRAETGTSKGVLYVGNAPGVPWNGLISVTQGSEGAEPVDLWSDNIKYCSFRSAETFSGTIEAYQAPKEFGRCDGTRAPIPGVYLGQQKREQFGFCYRTEIQNGNGSSSGYKLHLLYNITASPSEKALATINDSPDAATFSWDLTSNPFIVKRYKPSSLLEVVSYEVSSYKLRVLEDILYGTEESDPRLPTPEEVVTLLGRLDLHAVFIEVLSIPGNWIWDTFNFYISSVPRAIELEAERHIFYDPDGTEEYIQPSIAYKFLSYGDDASRIYSVDVIDENDPSELAAELNERLDMQFINKEVIGEFTYFHYTVNVY